MPDYLEYTVTEADSDRLDSLAYRMYADPYGYERIIRANPQLIYSTAIAPGTVLQIPVIDSIESSIAAELVPPWRRPNA